MSDSRGETSLVRPTSSGGGWLVWEKTDGFPTVITPWDLEFYENIKSLYPMMGGLSRIGAYMKVANCIGLVKEWLAEGNHE